MNEDNLYYKRGMYIIDKLLKIFNNDTTFYKKRDELIRSELNRIKTNRELVCKDYNSFYITSLTALLGINKENIEQTNKHDNYKISILKTKNETDKNLQTLKNFFKEFTLDRKITTMYDDWLCVENCDYPTQNYLMNIRNGLMHSEYEHLDNYGYMLSINNSNYTKFKSKALLPGLINFCLFYFGNNSYTGLLEKFNIYSIENEKINTKEELIEALSMIEINTVEYENIRKNYKNNIPEKNTYNLIAYEQIQKNRKFNINELLKKTFDKNYIYNVSKRSLDATQINIIEKMLEKYYGDEFYKLDKDSQTIQMGALTRYLFDSRSVISEWICDFIEFFQGLQIIDNKTRKIPNFNLDDLKIGKSGEENIRSVFANKTSLLLIKLYHVLYRLQSKKFEEIDYNKVDFDLTLDDYAYQRIEINQPIINNFEIDKANLKLKNPAFIDEELKNKVICEIIRNALSHGNIELNFKLINDNIVEYVVFEDVYHSKSRKLEITLDKLERFLKSEAFEVKNCLIKKESSKCI